MVSLSAFGCSRELAHLDLAERSGVNKQQNPKILWPVRQGMRKGLAQGPPPPGTRNLKSPATPKKKKKKKRAALEGSPRPKTQGNPHNLKGAPPPAGRPPFFVPFL
eukprot:FR735118.1.p3 GENE.FR735118.1~~FR735118.1.p3  ORF type:complete len:106 (+),score=46.07 FR735118.1:743-1060(+)